MQRTVFREPFLFSKDFEKRGNEKKENDIFHLINKYLKEEEAYTIMKNKNRNRREAL